MLIQTGRRSVTLWGIGVLVVYKNTNMAVGEFGAWEHLASLLEGFWENTALITFMKTEHIY
jgi:hypothetical protein